MNLSRASGQRCTGHPERLLYKVTGIYGGTELAIAQTVAIERVDHIGIRVRDLDRTLAFYRVFGFTLAHGGQGKHIALRVASIPATMAALRSKLGNHDVVR